MATQQIRLEWNGTKVKGSIKTEAKKRVTMAAEHFRGALVETLSGSRSGRSYKVPGTGTTYTASAPGEPPASRTGRLRQDISSKVEENRTGVTADVGTSLDYGLMLERGTRNMRPRPWLKPTFEKERRKLESILGGSGWTL